MNKLLPALIFLGFHCTYDSTPPGDDRINDSKPLLMIDATGLGVQKAVEVKYSDSLGATTLATTAEKTDGSGRFLYPLYFARSTRSYDLTISVDTNANGSFTDTGDLRYTVNGAAIGSDSEVKNLRLQTADFPPL